MTKSFRIFILAFALISLSSEGAYAGLFSSKIEGDRLPRNQGVWRPTIQRFLILEAALQKNNMNLVCHWDSGFPSTFLRKRELAANGLKLGPFTLLPTSNTT